MIAVLIFLGLVTTKSQAFAQSTPSSLQDGFIRAAAIGFQSNVQSECIEHGDKADVNAVIKASEKSSPGIKFEIKGKLKYDDGKMKCTGDFVVTDTRSHQTRTFHLPLTQKDKEPLSQ